MDLNTSSFTYQYILAGSVLPLHFYLLFDTENIKYRTLCRSNLLNAAIILC